MKEEVFERRSFKRRTAFAALRVAALVALVPLGSTGAFAMPFSALVLSLWCLAVIAMPGRSHWLSTTSIVMATAVGAYGLLQILPNAPFMAPAAVWSEASGVLGESLMATTSIAPGISLAALPPILVPLLVFAAALRLLDTDEAALRMLSFLAMAGVVVAIFGIVQLAFFPDKVIFFTKRHYLDSLTAVFVNRNNAATFLGATLILLTGLTVSALKGQRLQTVVTVALKSNKSRRDWRLLLRVTSIFLTVFALFLTNSRAGITSTLISLCLFNLLMSVFGRGAGELAGRKWLRNAAASLGLTALACLAGLSLLGGQTMRRIELRGTEDARFCFIPDIWRTVESFWPLGSGAGTFELAFLPFRNPACGLYGTLDRAHNFYLEGAVTFGVLFVVATIVVYAVLIPVLIRGLVRRQRYAFVPAMGLAMLLLFTLHDLLDFPIQIPGIAIWFAIILACCCGTALRRGSGSVKWKRRAASGFEETTGAAPRLS